MAEPLAPTLADEIEIMLAWTRVAETEVLLCKDAKESAVYHDRLRRFEATKATLNRLLSIKPEGEC